MKIDLVSLSQEMNLESGVVIDYFVLRLPSGHFVRAVVDEEAARMVHRMTQGVPVQPPDQPEPDAFFDGDSPADADDDSAAILEARMRARPDGNLELPRRRVRSVTADEFGNPVVKVAGGVDTGEVVGTSDEYDEDGIGQA